jgi:hypothetical protein
VSSTNPSPEKFKEEDYIGALHVIAEAEAKLASASEKH